MKDSEGLFQLIKSLSGPEKRYLKLISSIYEGNKNYLDVFNILVKQKNYDEQSFRKKIKNKAILKQLPRIKNYLYEFILKSVASYHLESSEKAKLNGQIAQITQLISRSLFVHVRKHITKSKKMAYNIGAYGLLLEILGLERGMVSSLLELEKIKNLDIEIEEVWNHMQTIEKYQRLTNEMFSLVLKEGQARNNKIMESANRIIEHPLLADEKKAINYGSKYSYHQTHAYYTELKGDYHVCYLHRKKLLNLMESHPIRIKEDQLNYIIVLNNLLINLIDTKKYEEFHPVLNKLRAVVPKNINNSMWRFIYSNMMELVFYNKTGQFENALQLQKKMNKEKKDKKRIPSTVETVFLFNFSLSHFGAGNYSECLKLLNEVMAAQDIGQKRDMHVFTRIFNLIVHFELGNELLFPYLLRSVYRYLLKEEKAYQYEIFILQFIRKLPKASSQRKMKDAFIALKIALEKLLEDPFEKHAFGSFDIISWLESKIEKRNFAEIVKEKSKT
jgi:hypothetical protein